MVNLEQSFLISLFLILTMLKRLWKNYIWKLYQSYSDLAKFVAKFFDLPRAIHEMLLFPTELRKMQSKDRRQYLAITWSSVKLAN